MIGAIGAQPQSYRLNIWQSAAATGSVYIGNAEQPATAKQGESVDPYRTPANNGKQKTNGDTPRELWEKYRCRTCENRTYQDGSNDPGVSMKTPTKVAPQNAAAAVMGHEQQHVARNAIKAESEGRRVLSSSVTIHTGVCGECGKTYVAGGTTRTVTASKQDSQSKQKHLDKKV